MDTPLSQYLMHMMNGNGHHIARIIPFDVLYGLLKGEIAQGNVQENLGPNGLAIYNYTIECSFKKKWTPISMIARGLILDLENKCVVATPFPKFFNFGEGGYQLPNLPFTSTEKMDGSLGIIFHHNGEWHVSTRGSFTSEQSVWAKNYIDKVYQDKGNWKVGSTYLIEIIYPENRIVIKYDNAVPVVIGGYDVYGKEIPRYELIQELGPGFFYAPQHDFSSVEEMIEKAKTLPSNKEGWVVRFSNGYRVKIKGDEYCRVHRLISNITPNRIWECMANGDNLEIIRQQLPEELLADYDAIVSIFNRKFFNLVEKIGEEYLKTKGLSDKDCGLHLRKFDENSVARIFTFPCRKMGLLEKVMEPGPMRKKVFKYFEPKGNKLEGYTPTSAVNRFSTEDDG